MSRYQLKLLIELCTHGINPINLIGRLEGDSLYIYSIEHRVFLPPSLTRTSFLNTDDKDRLQICNRPLSVQDPIELTRNVAQSVSRSQLKLLIELCTHGVNPINLFGRRKVGVKLWMLFEPKL